MKYFCKTLITILLVSQNIAAQTPTNVYTPKGSLVADTYITSEQLTAYDIQYINGRLAIEYPNAQKLQEATSTYNCHAYAWHMTEGGNVVWMGWSSNPTSIYWTDGSYTEVTNPTEASKVSYASDNHSAITTSQSDIFISKWGAWPLMKHQKNDSPYNSISLKYYKRSLPPFSIIGPSAICDQATYTIENLPPGATVQWSTGNSNLTLVSGQGTNTAVYRSSMPTNTYADIYANINVFGTIATLSLKVPEAY